MSRFLKYAILTAGLIISCKQNSQPVEQVADEPVEVLPQPVYRWGVNVDSLDIVDGIIGRNELLSSILSLRRMIRRSDSSSLSLLIVPFSTASKTALYAA